MLSYIIYSAIFLSVLYGVDCYYDLSKKATNAWEIGKMYYEMRKVQQQLNKLTSKIQKDGKFDFNLTQQSQQGPHVHGNNNNPDDGQINPSQLLSQVMEDPKVRELVNQVQKDGNIDLNNGQLPEFLQQLQPSHAHDNNNNNRGDVPDLLQQLQQGPHVHGNNNRDDGHGQKKDNKTNYGQWIGLVLFMVVIFGVCGYCFVCKSNGKRKGIHNRPPHHYSRYDQRPQPQTQAVTQTTSQKGDGLI